MRAGMSWCLIAFIILVTGFTEAQTIDRTCATCSRMALDSANLIINPVRVNQVGYRTVDAHKGAYVADPQSMTFTINRLSDNSIAYTGTLQDIGNWPELDGKMLIRGYYNSITVLYELGDSLSGDGKEHLFRAGFGDFTEEGTFRLAVGPDTSVPFDIRETIYNDVFETALKFFGVNRCGETSSWIHKDCHLRDGSALGEEFAGKLTGGWHDCGDHGKYSETVGYAALVLSLTYAIWPQKAEDRYGASYNDTLPFGNDGIPDLLWEAKIGADYIYKLYSVSKQQGLIAAADMYHSVGTGPGKDHNYWDVPENQDAQPEERGGPDRVVTAGIGSNVAGMYAATLALVSWGWEPFDPAYAGELRTAAIDIYDNIIMKKLGTSTTMPCCYTGGGLTHDDEAMAALALWFATGQERFGYDLWQNSSIRVNANARFNDGEFPAGHMGREPFHHGGWTTDYQQVNAYVLFGFAKLILPDVATAARYGITSEIRDSLLEDITVCLQKSISIGSNGRNSTKFPGINVDEPYHGVFTSADWGYNRYNLGLVLELFMYWDLTGDDTYYQVGMDNVNYNLGMNPWDISFIMGAGSKNLQHPHNRAANPEGYNAGGIPYEYKQPKGALMGGCKPGNTLIDEWLDYTVTETCIDFSSQLVLPAQMLAKDLPPDKSGPQFYNIVVQQVTRNSAIITWRTDELSRDTLYYSLSPGGPIIGAVGTTLSMDKGVTVSGLSPNTTYYFYLEGMDIFRNVARDNNKGLWYSFTTSNIDLPEAEISDVLVCNITHNSATVYWWTKNGAYSSAVDYSTDSATFATSKVRKDGDDEGIPVRFHKVTLTNLTPDTRYYFDVISGVTVSNNGGKHFSFRTTEVLVDYTIRIKPTKKGLETAHFYIEIANNEREPYTGVELRFYFNADPITAAGIVIHGFDNQLFDVGGIASMLSVTFGSATAVEGMINTWYIPITVNSTLPVAGRARIEFQVNGGNGGWGNVPFSTFTDAWSVIAHPEPLPFDGVDLGMGSVYEGPDPVEIIDGKPIVTYVNTPYITAYYKGKHVYGYPPDWQNNLPESHKTVHLFISDPVPSPQSYVEQDSFSVFFAGRTWAYPNGFISDIEINADPISFSKIEDRVDSVEFSFKRSDLVYGPNPYTIVSWHNKNNADCACAYQNLTVEVDTIVFPVEPRYIVVSPVDSLEIYQDKFGLIRIYLTDSTGQTISGEDITISLAADFPSIQFYRSPAMTNPVTTLDLEDGYAEVYVTTPHVLEQRVLHFSPYNPRPEYTYTDATLLLTILPRPLWPVISAARGLDLDGDLIPDQILIVMSEPFKPGQVLTGSIVNYANQTFSIEVPPITLDSIEIAIPLPAGLSIDPSPFGSVTLSMDIEGQVRHESGAFTDGIGPALSYALVSENLGTVLDTLLLTFSEVIGTASLAGATLELIKAGATDTIMLEVVTITASSNDNSAIVTVLPSGGIRVEQGDLLRLVPGERGSLITDRSGNTPHLLNRPVVIQARPPHIAKAWYTDETGDGTVETVFLQFKKPVALSDIVVSVFWGGIQKADQLGRELLSYPPGADSTLVKLLLPDSFTVSGALKTSGAMFAKLEYLSFAEEVRTCEVADSAAPVILKAVVSPGVALDEFANVHDTLRVTFSEKIILGDKPEPFLFERIAGIAYQMELQLWAVHEQIATYIITSVTGPGVVFPVTGDSIRINPVSAIADTVPVWQNATNNRKAPIIVEPIKMRWRVAAGPNPFIAGEQECVIAITPIGKIKGELKVDATISIFDAVGNRVVQSVKMRSESQLYPTFTWDGRNRYKRTVGSGIYAGIITVKDELGERNYKINIGVNRTK